MILSASMPQRNLVTTKYLIEVTITLFIIYFYFNDTALMNTSFLSASQT